MHTDFDRITNDETGQNHGRYYATLFDPRWKMR